MFKAGETIFIKLDGGSIACEKSHSGQVSHSGIKVDCKDNAPWGKIIPGGKSEGSFSITGAYKSDSDGSTTLSTYDLMEILGNIVEAVQGGTSPGDKIITVDVQITDVSFENPEDAESTFSGTLTFAGAPVYGVVTT